ncbi:HNH endonuclease [Microcoleus sp. FACHB-53]|nr:HNH endonuclease [Microcoleus sp. FACHB-53]
MHWDAQSSGTTIRPEVSVKLESEWARFLATTGIVQPSTPDKGVLLEGLVNAQKYDEDAVSEPAVKADVKRNPPWQRDELILALDLYFRYPPNTISKTHSEVVKLSEVLNSLPIHINRLDKDKFRNPNGVYMKLCNFLRFDPAYQGIGLVSGGKLEEDIWREFSSNKAELRKLANVITNYVSTTNIEDDNILPEEENFPEGKVLYRLHRTRERNRELVKKAKDKRKKEAGVLKCDVCQFNFFEIYGDIGADYIECHHTKPVSELEDNAKTQLKDIALVCANCHRMLHRKRPWLSIEQLKSLLKSR